MIVRFSSTTLLCILLIIINIFRITAIPIFKYASLSFTENRTLVPFDFQIRFILGDAQIKPHNPTAIFLPRFTRNLNTNANFSAPNITFSKLIVAPSSIFEAEFIDGAPDRHTYGTLPYISSLLIVRAKNNVTILENSTVVIKVFKENGIGAICGFPGFTYYNATRGLTKITREFEIGSLRYGETFQNWTVAHTNYTFSHAGLLLSNRTTYHNETFFRNTTIFLNNSRTFDYWTGMGLGCTNQGQCSGHGACDFCYQVCDCFEGYGAPSDTVSVGGTINNDCSARVCPSGRAIADIPTGPQTAHAWAECSNQGNCNRQTGECECFAPFTGSACERLACPNNCSSHGVCVSMSDYPVILSELDEKYRVAPNVSIVYGSANGMNTIAWDFKTMYQCVCESTWPVGYGAGQRQVPSHFGPDCSLKHCPSGDDPYTSADETNCHGKSQSTGIIIQRGQVGNKCQVDCSNRGTCDYQTGVCKCYEGSWGEACEFIAGTGGKTNGHSAGIANGN